MKAKPPKLRFRFPSKHQKIMRSRGVDGVCFAGQRNAFEFDIAAVRMKPDIPGIITKGISVRRQVNTLNKVFANPLRGHPVIGIGSFPSDLRARMLAVNIMDQAIAAQDEAKSGRLATRDYPLWHKVYGGLGDPLRDRGLPDNPSMLIISNVDADSTNYKIEKVRDIIEQHPNIPRIIVVSGCDPMWFFAVKLHLPMDYGYYIGADNREGKGNILDI